MGPVSQKLLTEEFGITAGSMSTMVDRLLARELITRHRNPDDLRSDVLELTQTGRAMLQDIRGVWQDVDDMLEASLGEEKAQLLTDLARELRIALGGTVPGKGKGRDQNRDESGHQGREKSTKADPKADAGLRLTIKQDREDDRS
jgi:DNA-binding MarR family transcriptional regulator